MLDDIRITRDFEVVFQQLQPQKQEIVKRKVTYLARNPYHPSLNAHRLKQVGQQIWECYIDQGMRLLYEIQQNTLHLWGLGGHVIVDRAHQLHFNRSASFLSWNVLTAQSDSPAPPVQASPASAYQPVHYSYAVEPSPQSASGPTGENNYFAYFHEAHLRVLGVPKEQVQAVKGALTLDEVLDLPDLPEQARARLWDLATSPSMKTVLLDPAKLLYRTRLDRLEGYFEGRIKKLMLNLEADQEQYIHQRVPLLLLKGTAGCGKTTIGIYRAISLAEKGRRVLVVTYNKMLASVTKKLIEELIGPLPANLEVRTAHSVMGSLLGPRLKIPDGQQASMPRKFLREALAEVRASELAQVLKREESFFLDEIQGIIKGLGLANVEAYKAIRRYGRKTALGPTQREAVWKVYKAYQRRLTAAGIHEWADAALLVLEQAKSGPLGKVYDDIIVDEAQDLKPVDLRVIQLLVDLQGTLMVLGDAAQTLYSRGFSWVQAGISARGRTSILRINHRNTRQIAEAASQLVMQNSLMRSSNEYVDPEWTRRPGPRPALIYSGVSHQQVDLVYQRILELLDTQQCRLSDIAILCHDNRSCQRCKDILVGYSLPAVLHTDSDFDILEEQIKIMTIHSAKGLEFPVVFLMGLNEGELPRVNGAAGLDEEEAQLEIERQRMLCYVGMTRAADMLYLVSVRGQESRFVRELAGKIEA